MFGLSFDSELLHIPTHFYEHLHAFRALQSEERCIIKMSEIQFYEPFDIQNSVWWMKVCISFLLL